MAITLYKEGSTAVVRGVQCDIARIEPKELQIYLERGYVMNPNDLLKPKVPIHTLESLSDLHYKKVDKIAKALGISTEGDKAETIRLILEKQDG